MSGLKPVTVNTDPAAEAHIYAEDDAAIYQSIFGSDGVLTIGQQCESQVISNNKVRVKDGVIVVGGHIARIPHADYCDCEIANGQSGRNRNDIIIAKFVTTGSGGIDTYTLEVKQGAATTGDATDPALTQNNLYESGKIREMPLYRVKIEGLSIVGVEQMFEVVPTIPTLNAYLSDLINETTTIEYDKTAINFTSAWSTRHCEVYKTGRIVQLSARIYSGTIVKDYEYTIANVNTEFRPAHETPIYAVAGDVYMRNLSPCMCLIQPGGKILFKTSGDQKQYVDIAGTYIV